MLSMLLWIGAAYADREARPTQYIEVAADRQHVFIMVPEAYEGEGTTAAPARGTAFRLESDGSLLELWSLNGWYGTSHLARGGRHLVREGPWASEPPEQELAVAFYTDGVEITRYTVSDLLKNVGSVQLSMSHYRWEGRHQGYPRLTSNKRYQLTTIEGFVITFDIETVEIVGESRIGN